MSKYFFATLLSFSFILITGQQSAAQTDNVGSLDISPKFGELPGILRARNIIKTNLASIALKNYSLQYERIINRKISIAVQYRIMPETGLPFKSSILKLIDDNDPDTKKIIEDFKMSNYAITPEIRLYLSRKGYGHGFYIAGFYRYASFTSNDFNVFYDDENNVQQSIKLSGKLTSNTGGILLGVQKTIAKIIVLDWWLLGPHYGSGSGNFTGITSAPLSQTSQDNLRDQLNDIDIPLTDKTVFVNANGAAMKLDGPWGGLRMGLSLGIRF